MKEALRVLVLVDWYEPGFKGGGITRSAINFVNLFKADFDIYVLTTNSDLGSSAPYDDIQSDVWINRDGVFVYYADPDSLSYSFLASQIRSIDPAVVYLNTMFSWNFSIMPAILKRVSGFRGKLLLSPRGSLKGSALSTKATKKKIFLFLFKAFGLHRKIHFQATDAQEYSDIRKVFGEGVHLSLLPDLPTLNIVNDISTSKVKGSLKLIFVGRAHPIKNLDFVLEALARVTMNVSLEVVVTREDIDYLERCESMIGLLPANISVAFHLDVPHAEVIKLLASSHVFILPTKGENFGHAIFEALFIGLPVIISDQTPWQNLAEAKAGFVFPLNEVDPFVRSVEFFNGMDEAEFSIWRQGSKEYAKAFLRDNPIKQKYKDVIC